MHWPMDHPVFPICPVFMISLALWITSSSYLYHFYTSHNGWMIESKNIERGTLALRSSAPFH